MSNESFVYGTAKALTANAFAKTGYRFAGWARTATGAKAFNDKQTVSNLTATAGAVVDLYALWSTNTYTVRFNKNASDATGTMANQGFTYDLNSLGWDSSIAACQARHVDGMIAGASITEERKENGWIFSDGYFNATQSMTVKSDSEITGFEDLNGLTVGVKTGTQGASYAESLQDEYGFELSYYEDSPTMYQAVMGGQVAACFEDTPIMAASIQNGALPLMILEDTANEGAPYGFAVFNEKGQELIDLFNAGLANIIADGTYTEIIAKYLGEETAEQATADLKAEAE